MPGTPEERSQHPINHRCFYSLGRAQEGVGTRLLAGTDSPLPSERVPSSTDSSLQLGEPTWTEGQFGSEVGKAHARSGEDSSLALARTAFSYLCLHSSVVSQVPTAPLAE